MENPSDVRKSLWSTVGETRRFPYGAKVLVITEERGGSAISVVDAYSLILLGTSRTTIRGLSRMAIDASRGRAYAMSLDVGQLAVFDIEPRAFMPPIATSSRGVDIELSSLRDEI